MTIPNQQPEVSAEAREAAICVIQESEGEGVARQEAAEQIVQRAIDRATETLRLYNDAHVQGINELWQTLEAAGFIPCNDGWLGSVRVALSELAQLRAENEALRKDEANREFYAQWYPVKELLPLSKPEGSNRNFVLAAWMKAGALVAMRTCYCDRGGVWWITPDVRSRTEPNYWRELPDGPLDRNTAAMAKGEAK